MAQDTQYALGTFSIAGGTPFAGLVIDGKVLAVQALVPHADALGGRIAGAASMLEILEDWERNLPLIRAGVKAYASGPLSKSLQATAVPVSQLRVHAPVENPRQMFMARANYRTHIVDLMIANGQGEGSTVEEKKASVNRMVDEVAAGNPYAFQKLRSAITGPYDDIPVPITTEKLDWEMELAVIIGKPAFRVSRADALKYVAGYCNANDLSARDLLFRTDLGPSHDWTACKSQPGFMPMGPYMVPADFIPDPQNLQVQLKLNGKMMQDEKTNDMLHDVARLIEHYSRNAKLLPGDIISTGSPNGNGMQIGVFLKPGDVVEGTVTGLGELKNRFVAEAA